MRWLSFVSRTCVVSAFILLSACVSSQQEKVDPAEKAENAAQVNLELGIAYMQKNENERALNKLQKAIKIKPKFADAHNAIGILYARLGEDKEARRHYEKAIHYAPKDSRSLNNYGQFLCSRGERAKADTMFKRAIANPLYRSPEVAYLNAGLCAKDNGDFEEAEINFRAALQKHANFGLALYQMAELSYLQHRYKSAESYLQRHDEATNETAASLWLAVRVQRALGDRDKEASYSLKLKNNFPDSQELRLLHKTESK